MINSGTLKLALNVLRPGIFFVTKSGHIVNRCPPFPADLSSTVDVLPLTFHHHIVRPGPHNARPGRDESIPAQRYPVW